MESKIFRNVPIVRLAENNSGKLITNFRTIIEEKYKVKLESFWDLHGWTVENIPEFWAELWEISGIIYSKPFTQVIDMSDSMSKPPDWFEGSRVNYAENILKYRDDRIALIVTGEEKMTERISYAQLYEESCLYGSALRKLGIKAGDQIACYMSNRKEPIFAMLGTTSIGAVWSGALPLMGVKAVVDRLKQIGPKILFTVDRFLNNGEEVEILTKVEEIAKELTTLEKVVIVPSRHGSREKDISKIKNSCFLDEFLALGYNKDGTVPPMVFEQLPFSHPVFINYTSGTTGTPKAIIHGSGVLLGIYRDFWLHCDGTREDTWLSFYPVGWMTWNMFASTLFFGVTVVLFEGVPFYKSPTHIWDIVDNLKITRILLVPAILDELEKRGYFPTKKNHLSTLREIMIGGTSVKPQNYEFVRKIGKPDIIIKSIYGCTEIMGSCATADNSLPVYMGEITTASFGTVLECYDEDGNAVRGEVGDVVITTPTPSMALAMWGDNDGSVFKATYFSKYKDVFAPGDLCVINPITKGYTFPGRSDNVLKANGVKHGSSEIYNIVEKFSEVRDSACVPHYRKDGGERAVLFLKMKEGEIFTEELVDRIRGAISKDLSPNQVPEVILQAADIPYNMNGKKMELLVKKVINNIPYNAETIINAECLTNFENIPQLMGFHS